MKRVAFVTYRQRPTLTPSDALVVPHLAKEGIEIIATPWDDGAAHWESFDAVIIRSAWNYHIHYRNFLVWLEKLEALQVPVWNPIDILRWNTNKTYLSTISKDIPVVPTRIITGSDTIPEDFSQWEMIVIKPAVSASAFETKAFSSHQINSWQQHIRKLLTRGPVVVQQYIDQIHEGEYSYIFFDKKFSHAVLKTPTNNDFRVQAEFGGLITPVHPSEQDILPIQTALHRIAQPLLYARVDGLMIDGTFTLMEYEFCEPQLFLDTNVLAPQRFAKSVLHYLNKERESPQNS